MVRRFLTVEGSLIYMLISIVVSVCLIAGFDVWYTQRQISHMERKFCDLVVLSDDAYKQPTPPGIPVTPTRQKLAAANHKLRVDLRCDDKK